MLNRLQVREKLTLLVVVPLVAVALLLVPLLAGRLDVARSAGATAGTAALARDAGVLVERLQSVRLLAVAYLSVPDAAPAELTLAVADVESRRVALAQQARAAGATDLAARLDGLAPVGELGRRVLAREATQDAVVAATSEAVGSVVDGLGLTTATGEGAGRLTALDTLLRADEASARSGVFVLVAATSTGARRAEALAAARDASASATALGSQFARLAPGAVAELFGQATGGPSGERLAASRAALERAGSDRVADRVAVEVYGAVRSENAARQLVETRVAQEVAVTAGDAASAATLAVSVVALVVVVLFLLVVALTVVVGRSVSRPLRRLTGAAGRVADLAQAELLRVADEDDAQDVTPRLAAVEVGTDDEIGELAEAFNRVQASAALLLQRQVVSRRNVATMFAGVGRRTSNLVGRQLALIDRLERAEDDPDTLAMLYRLDHVSTRLRRNASSLVVLSGSTESAGEGRPVAIADAVRGALGTVEEYQRVMIGRLPAVFLAPGAASDLVLLLAELMENAVLFSPPSSTVEVTAERSADGVCVLSVVDHGLGMAPDRFAVENARLKERERLDLAPTDVLGLFVVGRIARRHGLDVRLEPTADQGVTAVVTLPPALLVDAPVLPPAQVESRRSRQQRPQTERVPVPVADATPAATVLAPPPVGPPAAPPVGPPVGPPIDMPPPTREGGAVEVTGVPRRVPGAHFARGDVAPPAPAARATGPDADRVRSDVDELEAAVERAAQEQRDARYGVPGRGTPAAPPAPAAPSGAAEPGPAGVRRRVPGRALEAFDTTPAAVASPSSVDADEVRAALDGVGEAVNQALLAPPERTVRTRRREAERDAAAQEPLRVGDALAQQARARAAALPDTVPAAAAGPEAGTGSPADADAATGGAGPGLVRRRPGQALAALEETERESLDARAVPRTPKAVAATPERPEEVLAWADDLETAMARVDDVLATAEADADAGTAAGTAASAGSDTSTETDPESGELR